MSITGGNGSGKTTLSRLMCGLNKPDRGQVLINGEDSRKISLGRVGSSVGYLFQEPSRQLFAATVWEEMTFLADILSEDMQAAEQKARNLLADFALESLMERSVYRLSRGERQRLALCSLIMRSPRVLILDEPTAGLDQDAKTALFAALERLNGEGRAICIVTHDELPMFLRQKAVLVERGVVI